MNRSFGFLVVSGGLFAAAVRWLPNVDLPLALTLPVVWLLLAAWGWAHSRTQPVDWLLGWLVLVPLEYSSTLPSFPRLSVLDYSTAISLTLLLYRGQLKSLINGNRQFWGRRVPCLWAMFLLYGAVLAVALHGSVKPVLRWGQFLFVLAVAVQAWQAADLTARYRRCTAIAVSAVSLLALVQWNMNGGIHQKVTALFGQHNGLGSYLLLTVPILSFPPSPAGIAGLLALVAARSRGSWLGLVVGLAGSRLLRRPIPIAVGLLVLWLTASLAPLALAWNRPALGNLSHMRINEPGRPYIWFTGEAQDLPWLDHAMTQRPAYWRVAADALRAHFWFGLGPGRYATDVRTHMTPTAAKFFDFEIQYYSRLVFWQHLHSLYLQQIVVYGFAGFLIWSLAMLGLVVRSMISLQAHATSRAYTIIVLGFLAHNTVDYLQVGSYDFLFAMALAAAARRPDA